jgi:hypothetical protein
LPADGWTLRLQLTGKAFAVGFDATPSGSAHLFSLSAATTAAWIAGSYSTTLTASRGTERYTLSGGRLAITPNYQTAGALDTRSTAQRGLDNVNEMLSAPGGVSAGVQSYKIAGRELSRYSIAELLKLRDHLKAEVRAERVEAGLEVGGFGQIRVRFTG